MNGYLVEDSIEGLKGQELVRVFTKRISWSD